MSDSFQDRTAMDRERDIRPVPDPTTLTTQQLHRELLMLRELVETRLGAMDKATQLLNENMTRVPTDTDKQISHLRELHEEKFSGVQKQFDERDTRTEQAGRDSKVAIDAALQAAKEAVGQQTQASDRAIAKSETATMKQLDQLGVQIQTETRALDGKIGDIKERLTSIEGRSAGMASGWAVMVAAVGMLLGVGGLILAVTR